MLSIKSVNFFNPFNENDEDGDDDDDDDDSMIMILWLWWYEDEIKDTRIKAGIK